MQFPSVDCHSFYKIENAVDAEQTFPLYEQHPKKIGFTDSFITVLYKGLFPTNFLIRRKWCSPAETAGKSFPPNLVWLITTWCIAIYAWSAADQGVVEPIPITQIYVDISAIFMIHKIGRKRRNRRKSKRVKNNIAEMKEFCTIPQKNIKIKDHAHSKPICFIIFNQLVNYYFNFKREFIAGS